MKARLIPIFFKSGRDEDFDRQFSRLKELLAEVAEILEPVALGSALPEAEGVVFPQLLGDAYTQVEALRQIPLPKLIVTSEFGTVSMWDWEIAAYLQAKGIQTLSAPNLEETKTICRALGVKRELQRTRFLVFQDNPGQGFQASIFKRFYWWEDECTQQVLDKFGVQIIKKSFQKLASEAKTVSDLEARTALNERAIETEGVSERALLSAMKLYLVLKRELEGQPFIGGMGINCLNESHFSDTTPCLAWNLLFEEQGLIWGCEADTLSMLTEYILHKSLGAAVMMTNLYPFRMGEAATRHEHIPGFPQVPDADDCVLAAHCGYLGVTPSSFSSRWSLKPKVLAIVDDNATAIDARLPTGEITLVKLAPLLDKLSVVVAVLEDYVQFPNSDCLNGALIRVPDGQRLLDSLVSHHYILMTGHRRPDLQRLARVFGLGYEEF